jgi:hypothetical protein
LGTEIRRKRWTDSSKKRVNSAAVSPASRRRLTYVALALSTIGIGLFVHLRGSMLSPVSRDILGDALWAAMIVWLISARIPNARRWTRYGVAYAVCALVETSQALHTARLDALRATTIGHLVLGSGFDPRDFLAYALGVVGAALLDVGLVARRANQRVS